MLARGLPAFWDLMTDFLMPAGWREKNKKTRAHGEGKVPQS